VKGKTNSARRARRRSWRQLLGSVVLGLGLTTPLAALAQGQPAAVDVARLPEKLYMSKNSFFLPVTIDERARASIREVRLYVREGVGGRWLLKDSAPPSQPGFNYRLAQDGEYWFAVVAVDQAGKASPADVTQEFPDIIVVLDTQGPQVELKALPSSPEGICVRCDVRDANPNPFLTKFEYQTADQNWRQVEPMPGQADCFYMPRQAVLTGMCRVSCTDRAQNTTTREFNLASLGLGSDGAPLASKGLTALPDKAAAPVQQTLYTQTLDVASSAGQATAPAPHPQTEATAVCPTPAPSPVRQETAASDSNTELSATPHLINHRHLSLEYRLQDVGASGVGKVELWITRDGGANWEPFYCDPKHQSPIEFDLPGEGRFGLRLVNTNGLGFGDGPPRKGDAPDYIVEVDTVKPQAELVEAKLAPVSANPYVDITWRASDENFGAEPIDLYYSMHPQGPWTAIVNGWQNSGHFKWFLPRGIGREAYLRLVATDLAGNSVNCDMGAPVLLDDNSRPSARIVGIDTSKTTKAPTGN
jgi:hypothetical protein